MEKPEIKLLPCQREMLKDKERVVLPIGKFTKCRCERTKLNIMLADKDELSNDEKHLILELYVNQCCYDNCGIRRKAE